MNLLDENVREFKKSFHDISRLQYLYFSKMIPESIKNLWLKGLETKEYFMKLCGAGGGGYFITFSDNDEFIESVKNNLDYDKINYGSRI